MTCDGASDHSGLHIRHQAGMLKAALLVQDKQPKCGAASSSPGPVQGTVGHHTHATSGIVQWQEDHLNHLRKAQVII